MKTILVPIDFSDVSGKVVETAASLAEAFGSQVILIHVTETQPQLVGYDRGPLSEGIAVAEDVEADQRLIQANQRRLDALKEKFGGADVLAILVQGSVPEEILTHAREHGATLIVIGSHGHGALYHLLVGSVANAILKAAPCPVLVVPSDRGLPGGK
jgi:nucleotide-binding universal stress UspA family protein